MLYNNTAENSVMLTQLDGTPIKSFPIHLYNDQALESNNLPKDHARQGFGRGLCVINNGEYIVAGSSPSTISV